MNLLKWAPKLCLSIVFLQVSQRRFLLDPPSDDYQWFIPLTYTVVGDDQTDFEDYEASFFLEPDQALNFGVGVNELPIVFNIQAFGYYRYFQNSFHVRCKRLLLVQSPTLLSFLH